MSKGLFYCFGCSKDVDVSLKHKTKKRNSNFICTTCVKRENSFNKMSLSAKIKMKLMNEARDADKEALIKKKSEDLSNAAKIKQSVDDLEYKRELERIDKEYEL